MSRNIALTAFLAFSLSAPSYAEMPHQSVDILSVTSDAQRGKIAISLVIDRDQKISKILANYPDASAIPIEQIKDGITLMKFADYEVIKLYGDKFSAQTGGSLRLNYLYNGITGSRSDFSFELDRSSDGKWTLYSNQGRRKAITKMYLESNRVAGKIVGVAKVTVF
jgi:hypothetical protein